jgi:NRAMP (natural resistance-associated macrophage protein)-like metal ion transporter
MGAALSGDRENQKVDTSSHFAPQVEVASRDKRLDTVDDTADAERDHGRYFSVSELRRELGLPLVVIRRLIIWGEIAATKTVDGTLQVSESEIIRVKELIKHPWVKTKLFIRTLGPGVITGASDDDPGGIGTYASVGAQFGFALLWMAVWILPLMLAVQETCARIGIVTDQGLSKVLTKHYKKSFVGIVVLLLIVANVVNIGADLGAMAASLRLLVPIEFTTAALFFALVVIAVELFIPYKNYVSVLKWLTLAVLAYVVTGFVIKPDWVTVLKEAVVPEIHFDKAYIFAMVAVLGTSITPYLFFWQTSEEVEESKLEAPAEKKPKKLVSRIARMRSDVSTGIVLANLVFFFVIMTTASVLFKNGITSINSAEEAAQALRPLAGDYAYLLFSLGIIGTGLLAVPILAGSGAYALAEVMKWREGLGEKIKRARAFYMVIVLSIILGLLFNLIGINPIKALYYSAFLNGVIAVPLLAVIMIVGNDKKIMGLETHPTWVKVFGWLAVAFMAVAVVVSVILMI